MAEVNLRAELGAQEYQADIEAGNTGEVIKKLRAKGLTELRQVPRNEIVEALAPFVSELDANEIARLEFLMQEGADMTRESVRTALRNLFVGKPSALVVQGALQNIAQGEINLDPRKVREALKTFPTSKLNNPAPVDPARVARINRVGRKIRALRDQDKLRGDDFTAFRANVYAAGTDEQREAFVDATLLEHGLVPGDFS